MSLAPFTFLPQASNLNLIFNDDLGWHLSFARLKGELFNRMGSFLGKPQTVAISNHAREVTALSHFWVDIYVTRPLRC